MCYEMIQTGSQLKHVFALKTKYAHKIVQKVWNEISHKSDEVSDELLGTDYWESCM
jgi:hypothetical protein